MLDEGGAWRPITEFYPELATPTQAVDVGRVGVDDAVDYARQYTGQPQATKPWTAATHTPLPPAEIPAGWRVPDVSGSAWGVQKNLMDGWYAPSPVASEIERVWKMAHDPQSQKAMLKVYKQALNTWRGYALLAPSYHVRNLFSNVWQNFIAGVTDPIAYYKATEFQKAMFIQAKDGGAALDAFRLATPFGELTGPDLRRMLFDEDLLGGFMSEWAKEVDLINSATASQSKWLMPHRKAMHWNLAAGTHIENNARFALMFDQLGKGGTPQEAADMVRHFLFDYSELGLSKFENDVMRPLTSFYRWTKNNMLLSTEQMFKQPGKYAAIPKVKHAVENMTAEGSPPETFLPEWLAEGGAVRWKGGEDPRYFSLQNWLPAMQVAELFEDVDEHHVPGLSWALGMAAPTITLPLEQYANKSFFFEQPIERDQGVNEEFLGQMMNPRLIHLLKSFRPLSEANRFTRAENSWNAIPEAFGGKSYGYDYQKEQRNADWRKRERLDDLKAAWKRAVRTGKTGEAERLKQLYLETKRTVNVH